MIARGKRPEYQKDIPQSYKNLIEECWDKCPEKRPSFNQIRERLKNDKLFHENVDLDYFFNYVNYVDNNLPLKDFENVFKRVDFDVLFHVKEFKRKSSQIIIPGFIKTIKLNDFLKQQKIGRGGFAKVYKIVEKKTNKILAAKIYQADIND